MPVLENDKWETLAQCMADGMHPAEAYIAAGYSKTSARTAVNGMLKRNPCVLERRDEIMNARKGAYNKLHPGLVPVATEAALANLQITKEVILAELWDNAMKAKQAVPVLDKEGNQTGVFNANFTASNQALQLIGKEFGMFSERKKEDPGNEMKVVHDVGTMSTDRLRTLELHLDNIENLVAPS